jgi:glycosyltransferase involved in cell wall biosynthesis
VPAPLFLDLSHTSHTRARTGVQRVARSLRRALGDQALGVCFDPYERAWRPLSKAEGLTLDATAPAKGRGSRWSLAASLRGRMRRLRKKNNALSALAPKAGDGPGGVLVPEIFSPGVARALPQLFAASPGPRVALFHDAIALQHPEFTPRGTVARFPAYLQELLQFDGIAAVSEASRQALLDYWGWLGATRVPEVAALPLGLDLPAEAAGPPPAGEPTLLCVGSIEARKNHLGLLEACEALWSKGLTFKLHLVGLAHAETGGPALKRIAALKSAGRPVSYDGPADERGLEEAYQGAAFTVYPSLAEGFGLPVAESLARGRPCLCRFEGALGEIARGGGCMDLGDAGAPAISAAVEELLLSPARLASLSEAARARRFKTWPEYVAELLPWMKSLGRHA